MNREVYEREMEKWRYNFGKLVEKLNDFSTKKEEDAAEEQVLYFLQEFPKLYNQIASASEEYYASAEAAETEKVENDSKSTDTEEEFDLENFLKSEIEDDEFFSSPADEESKIKKSEKTADPAAENDHQKVVVLDDDFIKDEDDDSEEEDDDDDSDEEESAIIDEEDDSDDDADDDDESDEDDSDDDADDEDDSDDIITSTIKGIGHYIIKALS